jgi:virginiamycin A acetyltransferase
MIKISIVTINLNMKDGLEKSIKSSLAQDSRDEIEYIVVDGESTDGSQDVIEKYRSFIDKVKIEKDTGIFDAMNKGIDLASGEYIYFLNSGDEFASDDVLKYVIGEIDKNQSEYNILYGQVATYRFGEYIGIANLFPWLAHQGAFVKTQLMKEYKFDDRFKIFGDLDFWTRLSRDNKYKYRTIDKIIANMEIDGIGSHPKYTFKRLKDKRHYAKKHKQYMNYIASCISESFGYIIYKIFGEKFYYHYFSKISQNIKKIIKRLFMYLSRYVDDNSNIGKNTFIGKNVTITRANIGNYCSIAPHVSIGPGEHDLDRISTSNISYSDTYNELTKKPLNIGHDVWIGTHVVILRGVTIGNGAVIGAGSVVTKDIPDFAVAVGVPAKVIKYRFNQKQKQIINDSRWWDYDKNDAKKILLDIENKFRKLNENNI